MNLRVSGASPIRLRRRSCSDCTRRQLLDDAHPGAEYRGDGDVRPAAGENDGQSDRDHGVTRHDHAGSVGRRQIPRRTHRDESRPRPEVAALGRAGDGEDGLDLIQPQPGPPGRRDLRARLTNARQRDDQRCRQHDDLGPVRPIDPGHPTETLADMRDGITGIDHGVAELDHECHQLVQRGTVDR